MRPAWIKGLLISGIGLLTSPAVHAAELLASYRLLHPELRGSISAPPLVEVFADGQVRVNRPHYYRQSGTWELRLDAGEFDRLSDQLKALDLAGLDTRDLAGQLDRRREAQRAASGAEHYVEDGSVVIVTLGGKDSHRVSATEPGFYAKHYPEIDGLRKLSRARELFESLASDGRLARVSTEADR